MRNMSWPQMIVYVIAVIALTVGVLGGVGAAFGAEFLPKAGDVLVRKVDQLCLNPKGCQQ